MPMQKGMNSFIRWKRLAGETMGVKKNRERFSIKFNENDPTHDAVIRLLEKQGPHSKAQFIVNAILHYVNCSETPDISAAQTADRAFIEKIVMEVLSQRCSGQRDLGNGADIRTTIRGGEEASVEVEQESRSIRNKDGMDEVTYALIADTMLAFRGS